MRLNRLADRLGVSGIVLMSLHISRRPAALGERCGQRLELARPMMRRGAGFNADQAWRQLLKGAASLTAKQDFALGIDAVNLENRRSVAPATPPS